MTYATMDCHCWIAASLHTSMCYSPTNCNGDGGGCNNSNNQQSYMVMEKLFALKTELKSLKKQSKMCKHCHDDDDDSNDK